MIFPGTLPLGVLPKAMFEESRIQLIERDQLALYTDGLLEARSQNGDLYSFGRLKTLFASDPPPSRPQKLPSTSARTTTSRCLR